MSATAPLSQRIVARIDAYEMASALERHQLPGLRVRPVHFVPTWDKHRGADCAGAFLHVTDPALFPSVKAGLAVVLSGVEENERVVVRGAFFLDAERRLGLSGGMPVR